MQSATRASFQKSLIEIAVFLNHAYGLRLTESAENPFNPLVRWMDFRLRYLEPQPRQVLLAKHLEVYFTGLFKKPWTGQVDKTIYEVLKAFEVGKDVNARQSRTIFENDINAWDGNKKQPKAGRSDGLWNDWGVTHLHLSDEMDKKHPTFFSRSDWQIFCVVLPKRILVVDICKHKHGSAWADEKIAQIVFENWPWYANQFKIPTLKGSLGGWSSAERNSLRASGLSLTTEYNGHTYMPMGWGNTSANVGLKVMKMTNRLRQYTQIVADQASSLNGQIMEDLIKAGAESDAGFDLTLILNNKGLAIYERKFRRCYQIVKPKDCLSSDAYALKELLLPDWALNKLVSSKELSGGLMYP